MKRVCIDGNTAAANIAYMFNEMAVIYPITPSSQMAELCDSYSNDGKLNIFGNTLLVTQMQSEAGVAGALHGALNAGTMATTFTSSQGLLLMIPNMYKIAGELLPCVMFVSARTIATHALSIFCDYSDIYACMKTGFNIVNCANVQEINDFAIVCNLATYKNSTPFICFFDGFRTSHEMNTIEQTELEDLKKIVDYKDITRFKSRQMSPSAPYCKGTNQNPDVFFQNRVASLDTYKTTLSDIKYAFDKVEKLTGRKYDTIEYFGNKNAEDVVVCMGTAVDSLKKVQKNNGVVQIRVLKPFDEKSFIEKLPKTTKNITIIERNLDTNGYDTLRTFVCSALQQHHIDCNIYSGVYGLGGKEFTPDMANAVFENMKTSKKSYFTVGINDDVTHTSLVVEPVYDDLYDMSMRVYGLGSDGSVSASKSTIKILSKIPSHYTQGYFEYDSKKSGSLTTCHIRFDKSRIEAPYVDEQANFVQCNYFNYLIKYDILKTIKNNGTMLLNTHYNTKELNDLLPNQVKQDLQSKNINLYTINASEIAYNSGLKNKINNIMQFASFLTSKIIDEKHAYNEICENINKTFKLKGEDVILKNISALDTVKTNIKKIDVSEFTKTKDLIENIEKDEYYNSIIKPIAELKGNGLPVSSFNADGKMPTNTSISEKRGIAERLPKWLPEYCIQCGKCVMACPHAAIRPVLFTPDENTPEGFESKKHLTSEKQYRLQISPLDCTGCGVCSEVCPAKNKALEMCPLADLIKNYTETYEYSQTLKNDYEITRYNTNTVQFLKPYFEFSGACAGCGETPYIKLLSQLYGDRLLIANATGCSSIYGGTYPVCPYAQDDDGFGVAWANSLFEDNAEFGYGIALSKKLARMQFINKLSQLQFEIDLQNDIKSFLNNTENHEQNKKLFLKLQNHFLSTKNMNESEKYLQQNLMSIISPSVWILGGDGWAYDIGFGGLDHVLNSGENLNILILDTEVYSNTGGQTSKSTPRGASAKFNVAGKKNKKKDLLSIAMTYKDVYVAQVVMGANQEQTIKAFREAESYNGVSLIVAYSPCINHGYDMQYSQTHANESVKCGYNTLFRYDPRIEQPMQIDSAEPTGKYEDFLMSENRFKITSKTNPDLLSENKKDAQTRKNQYDEFKE